jgi:hypothetical protein
MFNVLLRPPVVPFFWAVSRSTGELTLLAAVASDLLLAEPFLQA